jgi:hypothetical protein
MAILVGLFVDVWPPLEFVTAFPVRLHPVNFDVLSTSQPAHRCTSETVWARYQARANYRPAKYDPFAADITRGRGSPVDGLRQVCCSLAELLISTEASLPGYYS